jgi:hypothetical protein
MRLCAVLWLTIVAGCSSSKADLSGNEEDAALPTEADDADAELSHDTGEVPPVAWELAGKVVLDADLIVEAESTLTIRVLGEDRIVLCEAESTIETATAMAPSQFPEEELLGWWRLFVEAPAADADSCFSGSYDFPVPVPMLIGVGPMHPEIAAAAGADIELGDISSLNGAYASMDGGETLWVFGVVGTESAFDGLEGPQEGTPLTDGAWTIEPVYPFPL